jgi:NADH dehydrogenase
MADDRHIVIVGGGFGGLFAARALAHARVRVTLIDRKNHHLFQPLLYQVATAGLSATDIAAPIRSVLHSQANATVLLADVRTVDVGTRTVTTDRGPLTYDALILSPGSTDSYFGHDAWEPFAPGLKTVEDALEIRRRILTAFENAEQEPDPAARAAWLTFAIVGAGPTGVELAGAIEEVAKGTLHGDFRNFDPASARVVLVDAAPRVLGAFSPHLAERAAAILRSRGVELLLSTHVVGVDAEGVDLSSGRLAARTVLWAAGVTPSPLGKQLGVPLDRAGRVLVAPDLSLPGHPEVFVVGDLCAFQQNGAWLPGIAQPAMQEGRRAAANALRVLAGKPTTPFHYTDLGIMATIGRAAAVAKIGPFEFAGFIAWAIWAGIHVLNLIGFRNRIVVMIEWAWAYFAFARNARVIVERGGSEGD